MDILTMPVAVFENVVTTLLQGETNKCVQLQAEDSIWTFGVAIDEQTGTEMFQVVREPILVVAK